MYVVYIYIYIYICNEMSVWMDVSKLSMEFLSSPNSILPPFKSLCLVSTLFNKTSSIYPSELVCWKQGMLKPWPLLTRLSLSCALTVVMIYFVIHIYTCFYFMSYSMFESKTLFHSHLIQIMVMNHIYIYQCNRF